MAGDGRRRAFGNLCPEAVGKIARAAVFVRRLKDLGEFHQFWRAPEAARECSREHIAPEVIGNMSASLVLKRHAHAGMTARSRVSTRVQQRITVIAMATVAKVIIRIMTTAEGPRDNAGTAKCRADG